MLTAILWKWSEKGVKRTYTAEHVNVAARMIRRHYIGPLKIICITDDPAGITECETFPLWKDAEEYKQTPGKSFPACYRRLKIFSDEISDQLGARLVSVDLDCVVTGPLNPLWDRPEPFVGWRVTNGLKPRVYNGSMFMFDAGGFDPIWTRFIADPKKAINIMQMRGYLPSDQSWMAHCLGEGRTHWTAADGVLSYRLDKLRHGAALPANARVVFFHGDAKPWWPDVQKAHPWIAENWG